MLGSSGLALERGPSRKQPEQPRDGRTQLIAEREQSVLTFAYVASVATQRALKTSNDYLHIQMRDQHNAAFEKF